MALITGSSRGIGKTAALTFAGEGAKVVINCRSSVEEAQAVVEEIKKSGGEAVAITTDLTKKEEVKTMFDQTLKAFGTLDILVNNAGIEKPKPFLEIVWEEMQAVFATNIMAMFLTSQEAVKIMQTKGGGKIINTASVRGFDHMGRVGNMDYSASKAAVINFTKTLAKAYAPNILVNAIAPGPTETDMAKTWTVEERAQKERHSRLGRLMQPKEIAQAMLYLASNDSGGITGEVIVVDGGYSLGRD